MNNKIIQCRNLEYRYLLIEVWKILGKGKALEIREKKVRNKIIKIKWRDQELNTIIVRDIREIEVMNIEGKNHKK